MREQKHRALKEERSLSPVLPEVLEALRELLESLPDLADDQPIFRSEKGSGRHQSKPLGYQGVRGVICELFAAEGVRREIPDAVPYDLRASFATWLGRSVRMSGGSVSHAKEAARRMLGRGDGDQDDPLSRCWDDERHLKLAEYSPIRLVQKLGAPPAENGGAPVENEGRLVEIGRLEPSSFSTAAVPLVAPVQDQSIHPCNDASLDAHRALAEVLETASQVHHQATESHHNGNGTAAGVGLPFT